MAAAGEPTRRRLAIAIGVLLVIGLLAAQLVPVPVVVLSLPFEEVGIVA